MSAFEDKVRVPKGTFSREEEALATGEQAWVVFSGKMFAGKDSLGELLRLPTPIKKVHNGDLLREKLAFILTLIRGGVCTQEAVELIVKDLRYSEAAAREMLATVEQEVKENPDTHPALRTPSLRRILQAMGDEWLPDDEFLAREAALKAMAHVKEGHSVMITGARFLPDVEIPLAAHALTVRVNVTEEVQLKRAALRDGLTDEEKLKEEFAHPGEVTLDFYPHNITVENNGDSRESMLAVGEEINSKIATLLEERRKTRAY